MRLTNHTTFFPVMARLALAALSTAAALAHADALQAEISGQAFDQARGSTSINQAVGNGSQQANVRALAVSPGGNAQAATDTVQAAAPATLTGNLQATIGGGAFRGAAGLVGINQSVGGGNAQANGVAIGLGHITEVSATSVLAGTAPNAAGLNDPNRPRPAQRTLSIDSTTFVGATGIVQVNQAGGTGNASANNFALGITAPKP
jgi:hypothetical protein